MKARILRYLEWFLWLAMAALLPLTSLPLLRNVLGGSAMVAPPSALPLAGLLVVFLVPLLVRRGTLPPQSRPLLFFAMAAVFSSLLAVYLPFPIFRESNLVRRMVEACLTLGVGIAFYLVSSTWPTNERRLRVTYQVINWSGLVMVVWVLMQAYIARTVKDYPFWMERIQSYVSVTQLFYDRATGFAFEPSWLAHQLNMLYLPYWLAASVRRTSAHRWRVLHVSFENVLLVGGVVSLAMSFSRVGLLGLLLGVAYLLVLANLRLVDWLQNRLLPRLRLAKRLGLTRVEKDTPRRPFWLRLARPLLRLELIVLLVLVYFALLFGTVTLLAKLDFRMQSVFDFTALRQQGVLAYANQLVFAERLVYWQVGWEVFNDHPWLGVGLGNVGYYFAEKVSGFGVSLSEVNRIFYQESSLPNSKSLWTRLLSETGMLGFGLYLAFIVGIFFTALSAGKARSRLLGTVGLAAQLAVMALITEGFSLDTFALPYYWLTFGLATAAWRLKAQTEAPSEQPESLPA